jgi:hypothetical protein
MIRSRGFRTRCGLDVEVVGYVYMYSLDMLTASFRRRLADVVRMKKPKTRARRAYVGPSSCDSRREREPTVQPLDSLTQKPTSPASRGEMDGVTIARLICVTGVGARLMVSAEALLKKLPTRMSEARQTALDEIIEDDEKHMLAEMKNGAR